MSRRTPSAPTVDPSGATRVLTLSTIGFTELYAIGILPFTFLVFVLGCAMGVGKAAVYKHIPEYFPRDVGAVGGLVGMLGGFVPPPLFAYTTAWSGFPTSTFFVLFVLTAICLVWMHWTVVHMLDEQSPGLATHLEQPEDAAAQSPHHSQEARA